ncbi:MAG: ADP-forming succinate--CoA ligase subunit beta [Candidatus Actinomarina sp.]|jgi:succinyl-CoA synthetase beta subunit|nr:ADP-forming succinate--CoA ligase subunit beta [Candidatus Actinomarina sp.]MDG1740186.1 ADP-forming succinate--CoA ligase subunit beta [Candidatus Actinomarina sp.]MDG2083213.1 ADP-forming succinate--CoA ligase subunit beta [Candidatus Actinomarina sp.]|tara:strand:- start:5594 stop:6727 length:1134 start_codon:yes stop_codon:yes gene_type:complete
MDLFEYQGKSLYANYDIAHPNSFLVNKIEDLEHGFNLNYPVVVKAQVQVGGRGKAGGIKLATNNDELITHTNEILGMDIKGHTVEKILIEEASDIKEEYYLSFTLDRSEKKYLMMLSAKGGMDIEAVAEENPDDLTMIHIDPSKELDEAVLIEAITNSKLNLDYESDLVAIITRLFKLFISGDCDLVEVNPLAITSSGVMALDSKVSLDMNAKYRHEDFDQIEKDIPIPPSEKSAKEKGLNFIKLDGSVGIIGNGAGLVMSTLDVVAEYGGSAANFLDIGGGAKAETVSAALEVLETDDSVSSVFINIFGGITRCDLVAQGIVEATKGKDLKWPIVIRLDGTNATEGLKILRDNPNEKIIITETMNEAAELSVKGNR